MALESEVTYLDDPVDTHEVWVRLIDEIVEESSSVIRRWFWKIFTFDTQKNLLFLPFKSYFNVEDKIASD